MKNLLYFTLICMLVISCAKDDSFVPEKKIEEDKISLQKGIKVDVCHKGKIINVSINAVPAHQAHGDAVDMDGDGYFDKDNECGPTDCDDTDEELTDNCGDCCLAEILDGSPNITINEFTQVNTNVTYVQVLNPSLQLFGLLIPPGIDCNGVISEDYLCYLFDGRSGNCEDLYLSVVSEADYNACLDLLANYNVDSNMIDNMESRSIDYIDFEIIE